MDCGIIAVVIYEHDIEHNGLLFALLKDIPNR